ncbi:MAG: type II toxin-antitoxin system PemK/MazF family toxin [Acetobacter sp.]|nr:type II toxin-antitoxin system PemK/MazF family toxin [Acetobacter sp.]
MATIGEIMKEKGQTISSARIMHRGEIYYLIPHETTGVEMEGGRPVVIVSCESCTRSAEFITVVCVTTRDKRPMLQHVEIPKDAGLPIYGTILCETVQQAAKSRIGNYLGEVPDDLMQKIEAALCVQLGLNKIRPQEREAVEPMQEKKEEEVRNEKSSEEIKQLELQVLKLQERCNVYKELYTELLDKQ